MVEWASDASERTFNQSAANGMKEPKPEALKSCCMRSQQDCRSRATKTRPSAQRRLRSFTQIAAIMKP